MDSWHLSNEQVWDAQCLQLKVMYMSTLNGLCVHDLAARLLQVKNMQTVWILLQRDCNSQIYLNLVCIIHDQKDWLWVKSCFKRTIWRMIKSLLSKSLAHGVGPKIPHNELSHNGNELEEYNDAHILLYVNTMKKMLLLLKHNIHLLFGQVLILSW